MSEPKRKSYTAPFKAKVGLEAIRGVKTTNEIAGTARTHTEEGLTDDPERPNLPTSKFSLNTVML